MASTKGHGNPNWNRDETLLALELYLETEGNIPPPNDPRIIALSDTLRALPIHPAEKRKPSFRNPDGVAFKLQNLRHVATGKGLDSTSKTDDAIWREFGNRPGLVKEIAGAIRAAAATIQITAEPAEEDSEFAEGRTFTVLHKRRERHPGLRAALLRLRKKQDRLCCEVCDRRPSQKYPEIEDSVFESHHRVGLSSAGERSTKLGDMALLCANCHRGLHRMCAYERRWVSVEEARGVLGELLK